MCTIWYHVATKKSYRGDEMSDSSESSKESSYSSGDDAYSAVIRAFNDEMEKLKGRHFTFTFISRLERYKARFIELCENPQAPDYHENLLKLCQDVKKDRKQKCALTIALYCFAAIGAIGALMMGAMFMPAFVIPAVLGGILTGIIGGGSIGGLLVLMGGSIVGSNIEGRKADVLDFIHSKLQFFSNNKKLDVTSCPETAQQAVNSL